jgi:hypothetical protein
MFHIKWQNKKAAEKAYMGKLARKFLPPLEHSTQIPWETSAKKERNILHIQ